MGYNETEDLLTSYSAAPDALGALIKAAPPQAAQGDPERWSAGQVLDHLVATAEGTLARITRITREDRPALEVFVDSGDAAMTPSEGLPRFAAARASEIEILKSLDAAGWDRVGIHPTMGEISVRDVVRHMSAHDMDHLGQIARGG
jgi:DinB superfamily